MKDTKFESSLHDVVEISKNGVKVIYTRQQVGPRGAEQIFTF